MASAPNRMMQWRTQLAQALDRLLWEPPATQPAWPWRMLRRSGQILYAIGRDMGEGQLSLRAMSLVYSTILGFIPMIALTFAVLKSLGVHNAMEPTLLTLLEALGDRRDQVVSQIINFVDNIQVQIIGITSLGLLVYLVLDMMRKIESAFNYIWAVNRGRSWSSRVSEYLFAVIVSPVLIFLSISITSSVNTLVFSRFLSNLSFGASLISAIAFLLPLLFMSLAFAFAYSFLPNTRVRFTSALLGGFVTTVVWKLMGAFFQGFFISAARDSIYLAFATVIAVMIFTYVGWLVALVGSDIAYYHQYPARCRSGRHPLRLSIAQQEKLALLLTALVLQRFQDGANPSSADQLAARLGVSAQLVDDTLDGLVRLKVLTRNTDEPAGYLPLKPADRYAMLDLWHKLRDAGAGTLPDLDRLPEAQGVNDFLAQLDQAARLALTARKFTRDEDSKT